VVKTAVRVH